MTNNSLFQVLYQLAKNPEEIASADFLEEVLSSKNGLSDIPIKPLVLILRNVGKYLQNPTNNDFFDNPKKRKPVCDHNRYLRIFETIWTYYSNQDNIHIIACLLWSSTSWVKINLSFAKHLTKLLWPTLNKYLFLNLQNIPIEDLKNYTNLSRSTWLVFSEVSLHFKEIISPIIPSNFHGEIALYISDKISEILESSNFESISESIKCTLSSLILSASHLLRFYGNLIREEEEYSILFTNEDLWINLLKINEYINSFIFKDFSINNLLLYRNSSLFHRDLSRILTNNDFKLPFHKSNSLSDMICDVVSSQCELIDYILKNYSNRQYQVFCQILLSSLMIIGYSCRVSNEVREVLMKFTSGRLKDIHSMLNTRNGPQEKNIKIAINWIMKKRNDLEKTEEEKEKKPVRKTTRKERVSLGLSHEAFNIKLNHQSTIEQDNKEHSVIDFDSLCHSTNFNKSIKRHQKRVKSAVSSQFFCLIIIDNIIYFGQIFSTKKRLYILLHLNEEIISIDINIVDSAGPQEFYKFTRSVLFDYSDDPKKLLKNLIKKLNLSEISTIVFNSILTSHLYKTTFCTGEEITSSKNNVKPKEHRNENEIVNFYKTAGPKQLGQVNRFLAMSNYQESVSTDVISDFIGKNNNKDISSNLGDIETEFEEFQESKTSCVENSDLFYPTPTTPNSVVKSNVEIRQNLQNHRSLSGGGSMGFLKLKNLVRKSRKTSTENQSSKISLSKFSPNLKDISGKLKKQDELYLQNELFDNNAFGDENDDFLMEELFGNVDVSGGLLV